MIWKRKTRLPSWVAIVVAAMGIYGVSIGPAAWLVERRLISGAHAAVAYHPLLWIDECAPQPICNALTWLADVCRGRSGLGDMRDQPVSRLYFIGDLAFRRDREGNRFFDVWDEFEDLISCNVECETWDTVGGRCKLEIDAKAQELNVKQSRQVHAAIAQFLGEFRMIKAAKWTTTNDEMDFLALHRAWESRQPLRFSVALQRELLARALVIGAPHTFSLITSDQLFPDIEHLVAFLDLKCRSDLRGGVFWRAPGKLGWSADEPEVSVEEQLKEYCQSRDVDLFVEHPSPIRSGQPILKVDWIVRASDSWYLD